MTSFLPISRSEAGRFGLDREHPRAVRAFTLVELLVVLAIIAIMSGIVIVGLPQMKAAANVTKAGYDVLGAIELARTLAMARNTYTWVGFFEENPSTPGTAGTGQVVISIVASTDGSQLPAANLVQVNKLIRVSNSHLDVLNAAAITRPTVPANTYQVGDTSFANGTTFNYPLTGTAKYTFSKIIQFNPQGDAMRINDTPTQWMEIGLRPTHGTAADSATKNVAAIAIEGIGGKATLYRP